MANNISDYLENKILDHVCGTGAAFGQPDVYVALCTAAPVDADTGITITEVTDAGGYVRQGPVNFDAAAGGACANSGAITFPVATADWLAGPVTHIALVDVVGHQLGNMLWHGALDAEKDVNDGDTFKINIGDLDLALN